MGKGANSRGIIIEEAQRQAIRHGLDGLSLGKLSSCLSRSKSGVFAHFRSKEALQLAVLQDAIDRFTNQVVIPAIAASSGRPRLEPLFLRYLDWIEDGGGAGGCLFMSAAQEFSDRPGPVRDLLIQSQKSWLSVLTRAAEDAAAEGAAVDTEAAPFELMGIALAFQHRRKLLNDPGARTLALAAFQKLITAGSAAATKPKSADLPSEGDQVA